jgi:hypothetical protein
MATSNPLEAWTSLALSLVIGLVAVLLGVRQWREHRARETGLSDFDRNDFLVQDLRRAVGIVLLAVLAPAIYVGSRLPTLVTEPSPPGVTSAEPIVGDRIPPAPRAHPNRRFLAVWLAVFVIIAIVLALALIDWSSTRRYARRQRQALRLEKLDILRQTHRYAESARDDPQNGPAHGLL